MAYGKWIGMFLGNLAGGILGGIAGFVLGSIIDSAMSEDEEELKDHSRQQQRYNNRQQGYSNQQQRDEEGQRNGFLFSLMVLSAHIIQADGKVMHSEMETVRGFLRQSFGMVAQEQGNSILLKLFEYRKRVGDLQWQQQLAQACVEMRSNLPEEQRIQLVAFLAQIVKADGKIDAEEIKALRAIAKALWLQDVIVDQMLSLGGTSIDDAYKVLGISPSATDDEVKKAYKEMVRKHHPDRVAKLGDDVRKAAEKKMQEINEARDRIYKERGI